ncbi:MAG: hypothetical protein HC824_06695 [Synechococcales cyanobacterium RM1_1_8]|nr:hypothetical protein [Synechococcales cyanobacterium RM1_1_8]
MVDILDELEVGITAEAAELGGEDSGLVNVEVVKVAAGASFPAEGSGGEGA